MRKSLIIVLLLLFAGMLSACHTRIVADNPRAKIYVDNEYEGTGKAKIRRVGAPATKRIEAFENKQLVASTDVERTFTYETFFLGMFSYYTGFYWGWMLPKEIHLECSDESIDNSGTPPWTAPKEKQPSPWDQPPGDW